MIPVIFGLSGPVMTPDERAFFASVEPAGYILFKRNIVDRAQVRALTDSLRSWRGGNDLAILIDQKAAVSRRMGRPNGQLSGRPVFAKLYEQAPMSAIQAMRANGQALGVMLREVGITVDCAPLLDVAQADTTEAIACRAYGTEPMQVAALGRAMLEGLRGGRGRRYQAHAGPWPGAGRLASPAAYRHRR